MSFWQIDGAVSVSFVTVSGGVPRESHFHRSSIWSEYERVPWRSYWVAPIRYRGHRQGRRIENCSFFVFVCIYCCITQIATSIRRCMVMRSWICVGYFIWSCVHLVFTAFAVAMTRRLVCLRSGAQFLKRKSPFAVALVFPKDPSAHTDFLPRLWRSSLCILAIHGRP